ncbi:transposase [Salinibacter ruber]|uniref:transposase n=1 Tax=Salinibacter ruber TaxID=146919 RepID=UPI002450002C|nr:hypothetical protein [Salinibacter ruber]
MPRKTCTTDLTDAEWELIEPLLPAERRRGAPRTVDLREVVRACLASVSGSSFQQKSAGQRLVKGTNLLTRQTQSDDLSVSL